MTTTTTTGTAFAEAHGDPCAILRIAVEAQGGGFHPDDDPTTVIDADGVRFWDDADAAEIVAALDQLHADGVDVYELTLLYLQYIGHEVEGCTQGPECECAAICADCGGTHYPTWHAAIG